MDDRTSDPRERQQKEKESKRAERETERIHTHAEMEDNQFPVFYSEPSRERGVTKRQQVENREREEMVNDSEERSLDWESRTESEGQFNGEQRRWRDEADGSLADDEGEDDDDEGHGMSLGFIPLVKIVRKTARNQMDCDDVKTSGSADDDRTADISTHWENTKLCPRSRKKTSTVYLFVYYYEV